MAELTKLEAKVAEVLGLAMASQEAADTVGDLFEDDDHPLVQTLKAMRKEARETQVRCTDVAGRFDRKKTAILAAAKETRTEAVDMMDTYLEGEDEPLDGFEFLVMAEAGELGHWRVVAQLNERAEDANVAALATWALGVQERHLELVLDGAVTLAAEADPLEIEG